MNHRLIEIPCVKQHVLWANQDYGIRKNEDFTRYDQRSLIAKINDTVLLILNELIYSFKTFFKRFLECFQKNNSLTFNDLVGKTNSTGLAIFFHGINGKESVWDSHKAYLSKKDYSIDIFAPRLPLNGHASVNGPESKILKERIIAWINEHPGKPIALFGQSRGSMFAVRIETWLRESAPRTPIHVSLTGAVLFGSSKINRMLSFISFKRIHLLTCGLLSKIACEELAYANSTAKKLLEDVRKPLTVGTGQRFYSFYASLNDTHVPDTGSSLPLINEQTNKVQRQYFCRGYGHNSIVGAVVRKQINDFIQWKNNGCF